MPMQDGIYWLKAHEAATLLGLSDVQLTHAQKQGHLLARQDGPRKGCFYHPRDVRDAQIRVIEHKRLSADAPAFRKMPRIADPVAYVHVTHHLYRAGFAGLTLDDLVTLGYGVDWGGRDVDEIEGILAQSRRPYETPPGWQAVKKRKPRTPKGHAPKGAQSPTAVPVPVPAIPAALPHPAAVTDVAVDAAPDIAPEPPPATAPALAPTDSERREGARFADMGVCFGYFRESDATCQACPFSMSCDKARERILALLDAGLTPSRAASPEALREEARVLAARLREDYRQNLA